MSYSRFRTPPRWHCPAATFVDEFDDAGGGGVELARQLGAQARQIEKR
ncbi:MAG: hypothetical protein U1F68_09060 [Gammaproteobacteria bacterium]